MRPVYRGVKRFWWIGDSPRVSGLAENQPKRLGGVFVLYRGEAGDEQHGDEGKGDEKVMHR